MARLNVQIEVPLRDPPTWARLRREFAVQLGRLRQSFEEAPRRRGELPPSSGRLMGRTATIHFTIE